MIGDELLKTPLRIMYPCGRVHSFVHFAQSCKKIKSILSSQNPENPKLTRLLDHGHVRIHLSDNLFIGTKSAMLRRLSLEQHQHILEHARHVTVIVRLTGFMIPNIIEHGMGATYENAIELLVKNLPQTRREKQVLDLHIECENLFPGSLPNEDAYLWNGFPFARCDSIFPLRIDAETTWNAVDVLMAHFLRDTFAKMRSSAVGFNNIYITGEIPSWLYIELYPPAPHMLIFRTKESDVNGLLPIHGNLGGNYPAFVRAARLL